MIASVRNQKGIALVATLMLLVLGFGVVAILFRLTTQETKLARLEQGYSTALDAAKAGADAFIYMVENTWQTTIPLSCSTTPNVPCLQVKYTNVTSSCSASPACANETNATSTDPTSSPDLTLNLTNGSIPYTVYVKIIDNYVSGAQTGTQNPNRCASGCYYYTVVSRAQPSAQPAGATEYAEVFFVYRFDKP